MLPRTNIYTRITNVPGGRVVEVILNGEVVASGRATGTKDELAAPGDPVGGEAKTIAWHYFERNVEIVRP